MEQHGFSLVEAAVAAALTLAIAAVVFALVDPSQAGFAVQPEAADMQQRLRVAAGTLYKDLVMAGAGTSQGPNRGSLGYYFAPVLPYRQGTNHDDPPGTFKTDTITLMYVPPTVAQTSLATSGPSDVQPEIGVNSEAGCPSQDASCGFRIGMTVLVYDASGDHDMFAIADVQSDVLHLEPAGGSLTNTNYKPDVTTIVQLAHIVYSLKSDAATGTYQLISRDGGAGADVPVVDHLVSLEFDYYGDPQPPALTGRSLSDPAGPWTTYGPPPPAPDEQLPGNGYPTGENCTFMVDPVSGLQVPRLAVLGSGEATNTLVQLVEAQLTDGPWCPDGTNRNRWDADLLRIRRVAVTLRVEAANAALRGPASSLFTHGGTSRGGNRWLPDREITFSVTPRNLMFDR